MIKIKQTFIYISIILILFVTGCKTNLEGMFDSYNSQFTPIYDDDKVILNPLDEGFSGSTMLLDKYVVSQVATLNLSAPKNCINYRWSIQDPESGSMDSIAIKTMEGTTDQTKDFVLYIPDSGLHAAKSYRLVLDVMADDAKAYTDYATLAVYNDYYFSTGIATIPPGAKERAASPAISEDKSDYTQISARSILPPTYNLNDSSVHYYLYAKELLTGKELAPFEINIASDANNATNRFGTTAFNLPRGDYFLTLMALNEVPSQTSYEYLLARCSLIAFATADTRFNQSATFVLKSSVNTFTGWANIKFYTEGWDFKDSIYDGYKIATQLLDYEGNVISPGTHTALTRDNISADTPPASPNYSISMTAGTYRLIVSIAKGSDYYEYSDLITISTNQITEAVFAIPEINPIGYVDFKIYTNGWNINTDPKYSGFTLSTTVTKAVDSSPATCTVLQELIKESLTDTLPSSANIRLYAELGSYILNVSFIKGPETYTWSYPFIIESGKVKTETDGIPSSVIPLGNTGGG